VVSPTNAPSPSPNDRKRFRKLTCRMWIGHSPVPGGWLVPGAAALAKAVHQGTNAARPLTLFLPFPSGARSANGPSWEIEPASQGGWLERFAQGFSRAVWL